MKYKVAVVGTGFASLSYIPILSSMDSVSIVAVYSRTLSSFERVSHLIERENFYTDFEEFLNVGDFDLIVLCLPPFLHLSYFEKCLRKGCSIIIEKPLGLSSSEAEAILQLAKNSEKPHFVNLEFRYTPGRKVLLDTIRNGSIGHVRLVNIIEYGHFQHDPQKIQKEWKLSHEKGGSLRGSHSIDLMLEICGRPLSVQSVKRNFNKTFIQNKNKSPAFDGYSSVLDFEDCIGTITVSPSAPQCRRRVDVVGSKGSVVMEDERVILFGSSFSQLQVVWESNAIAQANSQVNGDLELINSAMKELLADVLAAISGVSLVHPPDLYSALQTQVVLSQIVEV